YPMMEVKAHVSKAHPECAEGAATVPRRPSATTTTSVTTTTTTAARSARTGRQQQHQQRRLQRQRGAGSPRRVPRPPELHQAPPLPYHWPPACCGSPIMSATVYTSPGWALPMPTTLIAVPTATTTTTTTTTATTSARRRVPAKSPEICAPQLPPTTPSPTLADWR
ncbi:hypothetical protein PV327_011612, partial [Microctonus hyperodae]